MQAKIKCPPFWKRQFRMDFFNQNIRISIQISLAFVSIGTVTNITALVQFKSWRQTSYYRNPLRSSRRIWYALLGFNKVTDSGHWGTWFHKTRRVLIRQNKTCSYQHLTTSKAYSMTTQSPASWELYNNEGISDFIPYFILNVLTFLTHLYWVARSQYSRLLFTTVFVV